MSYSLSQAAIPVFEIGLDALTGVLDKALAFQAARKLDPATLPQFRLAPDMYTLARQVQIACELANHGASRLAGLEPLKFEDNEKTLDDLKDRVAKTVAHVKAQDKATIDAAGDREITFPLGAVNKGTMKGDDFLTHFVLPNFYFHCTAAYAILRHCGVEIGKRDFLGQIPLKMT